MKAALVVDTARSSLSTAVFGGSFILTGNLLSPYVGAVTCDLLFSYYQRSKYEQLKTRVEQHLKRMLEGLTEMKAAKSQVHTLQIPNKALCILHTNSGHPCSWYLMVPHVWCRLLGSADCMFCFPLCHTCGCFALNSMITHSACQSGPCHERIYDCRFRRQLQRQAVGSNQETTKFVTISGPIAVAVQVLYQLVAFGTVACNWDTILCRICIIRCAPPLYM